MAKVLRIGIETAVDVSGLRAATASPLQPLPALLLLAAILVYFSLPWRDRLLDPSIAWSKLRDDRMQENTYMGDGGS